MKKYLIASICLFLLGCEQPMTPSKEDKTQETMAPVENTQIHDSHTSENSLNWDGVYVGTVPCADCEGIETTMKLNNDNTFSLTTKYLGKEEDEESTIEGNFIWNNDGNGITLVIDNGGPTFYKVRENNLLQLDLEGNVIEGELADKYVLIKKQEAVAEEKALEETAAVEEHVESVE